MRTRATTLAIVLLVSACTIDRGEAGTVAEASGEPTAEQRVDDALDVAGRVADEYVGERAQPTGSEAIADPGEPAIRVPTNNGQIEATNWLARTAMDSQSVELVWSPVAGAGKYRLYRMPTNEADYDAIAAGDFEGADEVFEGGENEYGYVDVEVPTNAFLTYFVVAETNDGNTEARWTEALTVDDVTAPTPVMGLTAAVSNDGVLLEWEASSDDVEFAAYNVSLLTADGTAQYLGGGADETQTSFLDNAPLPGENRYAVTAVDFHNNVSQAAEITVTVE